MSDRLSGRIAIVTGSDSGIGRATAESFAREGADVVVTFRSDQEGAREICSAIRDMGRRAVSVQLDQTDPAAVARLFEETASALGAPDILVNNAGMDAFEADVAELDPEDWDKTIRTNLHGPFYCCQQFIRARRAAGGGGRIINVSSVHEEIARAGSSAYNASKGGLRNLMRTLALELAPERIGVNNIAPGMVLTPINQEAIDDPEVYESQVRNIPWKRAAEPDEVARLAVYLASDDADYVTGQTFTIDGGLSINLGQGA